MRYVSVRYNPDIVDILFDQTSMKVLMVDRPRGMDPGVLGHKFWKAGKEGRGWVTVTVPEARYLKELLEISTVPVPYKEQDPALTDVLIEDRHRAGIVDVVRFRRAMDKLGRPLEGRIEWREVKDDED